MLKTDTERVKDSHRTCLGFRKTDTHVLKTDRHTMFDTDTQRVKDRQTHTTCSTQTHNVFKTHNMFKTDTQHVQDRQTQTQPNSHTNTRKH